MTYTTETASPGHPIDTLAKSLGRFVQARLRRRGFRRLLDLDDQMLDDIGVTRSEVLTASRLPVSVNAAEELRRMSLERRRRRM